MLASKSVHCQPTKQGWGGCTLAGVGAPPSSHTAKEPSSHMHNSLAQQPGHSARRHKRLAVSQSMLERYASQELQAVWIEETSPRVKAGLEQDTLGVGFSAGGLLFPYLVGVVAELRRQGVLKDSTPVAGASAGSLIAACCKAGLSHEELVTATLELAADCRAVGTRHNLGPILSKFLDRMLPEDVHERATRCNVHIAVTQVRPQVKAHLINKFDSRADLISALLTSCHIPWYFDGSLVRDFRGQLHCDGGLTNFLPAPPGTTHTVKVCCFPAKQFTPVLGPLCIAPDVYEDWPHDTSTMLGWAFNPAADAVLLNLVAKGERDTAAWAAAHGLTEPTAASSPSLSTIVLP